MNVFDMMAKSFSDQLPSLVEKAVANLPPEVLANVGQIRDVVQSYKAQLDRIENQNRLIIAHLNIPAETEILENGDALERREVG